MIFLDARQVKRIALCAAWIGTVLMFVFGFEEPGVWQNVWSVALAHQALILAGVSLALTALAAYLGKIVGPKIILKGVALISAVLLAFMFGCDGFLGASFLLVSCFCLGHIFLRATKSVLLRPIDILAVGVAGMILLLTAVGIAQINMPMTFLIVSTLGIGATFGVPSLRQQLKKSLALNLPDAAAPLSWAEFLPLPAIVFGLVFYAANAALPEASWDPLVMHLMIATQILLHGHWNFDPKLYSFSFWPLGTDYLYACAMVLGGEMGAKLFNFILFCAVLTQLDQLVGSLYGGRTARYAVLMFLSIPLALVVTSSLYVENMLAFLTLAGVRLLILRSPLRNRAVLLSLAVILGALADVKLHGLFLILPFLLLLLIGKVWQTTSPKDRRLVFLIASVCAGFGLLPFIFAFWETGNPIFMFKNSFFHSPYWAPTDWVDSRWTGRLSPYLLYGMTFKTYNYLEAMPGALGFAFAGLLLPGLVACWMRPRREMAVPFIVAGGYLVLLLPQIQYIRYLYPIFPILILISMAGVQQLNAVSIFRPSVVSALIVIFALLGFYKFPSGGWVQRTANLEAIYDEKLREQILALQAPERIANQFINTLAYDSPRVLYAGLPYGALLKGTPIYTDWYDYTLHKALVEAKTEGEVGTILEAQDLDFMIVRTSSSAPEHQKVALYARDHFLPLARMGPIIVYQWRH